MTVHILASDAAIKQLLPGAQFADIFGIAIDDAGINARQAAERMFSRSPRWITTLMALSLTLPTQTLAQLAASFPLGCSW